MTKIKYDLSDVEAGGAGEEPQPGIYPGKIVSVKQRKKNKAGDPVNDLEIVIDIGRDYVRKWMYVQLENEATAWKYRELVDAVGLPAKGTLDTAAIEGKPVNVRIKSGTDQNGDYRGEIKNIMRPAEEDGAGPSDESEDYDEWTDDDLKAELEERGLEVKGRWTRDKAIETLAPTADAEEGGEEDGEEGGEDYNDWSLDDLKAEAESRGILGNISGRKTADKIREALIADDEGPSGEGSEAPSDDYDEWEENELSDEVKERELDMPKGRVTKDKLIAVLRADDAADAF